MMTMRPMLFALALLAVSLPATAVAQTAPRRPAARQAAAYPGRLQIRPFVSAGTTWFTASKTFKAVLGSGQGQDFGGGVNLTRGPVFIEAGARRFSKGGERVFVATGGQVFPLGIDTDVTMTPLEVTAGWRFRPLFGARVRPQLGIGYTRLRYEESAAFAQDGDDVDESFNGFHLTGAAEVRLHRWMGLAGEVVWTSVANAIGDGGASKAFGEDNLGGTSLRVKLVIGR
jgi:Outer membrane protein beta-barrel domain